jgi:alpha-glucosidase
LLVVRVCPDAEKVALAHLRTFVELCAEHDIPCDLFHLSSGYSTGTDGKRYVFTWNRERVPDPQAMVDHFHEAGIHLAPNIKPCLLTTHPRYAAGGIRQTGGVR